MRKGMRRGKGIIESVNTLSHRKETEVIKIWQE